MFSLCLDVGGTAIKYALIDRNKQLIKVGDFPTIKSSREAFMDCLMQPFESFRDDYPITSIGISFPGHIVSETGLAKQAGAIEVMNGENILDLVRERLRERSMRIAVENDAKCAAIAEAYSGNGQGFQDFCLLTIGTGIGGAIVHNKQVVRGHSYKAGELGMMIVDKSEKGYKNLHALASTSALIREYKHLKNIDETSEVHGSVIFEDPDSKVKGLLDTWSEYIALAIFNTVCQNDPEAVLIGGGISKNPALLPLILQALEKNPEWQTFKIPIQICHYHNLAGIWGVYHLVSERKI